MRVSALNVYNLGSFKDWTDAGGSVDK